MINVQYTLEFSHMFTGTFGVKGGGRFRVTTFYLLTVVFSRCRSLGCLPLQRHSKKPLPPPPPPDFQYPMNSPHYYSRYRKYFLHFDSLFHFLLNHSRVVAIEKTGQNVKNINGRGSTE